MRAVRFHGRGDIRVDEIDEPVCGDGQVKIRPAFVGICGSDLHEYLAGPITVPSTPHPITGGSVPVTLGHEFSGLVEEVGAGVSRLKVGDCVAVRPNLYDGTCASCLAGWRNCCQNLGFIGYSSDAGGLSDHVVVDQKHAILLPEGFPLDLGALVEPLTVAWHAVSRASVRPDDTVLVVGGGPIGLAVVQVLKARGVKPIIVSEVSSQRKQFARQLGATEVFDPRTDDIVASVRAMTAEEGAAIAFECSGVQVGLDTAIQAIRARGTVTIVSLWEEKPKIDALDIVLHEKHVIGAVICDDGDFEAVIDAISSGMFLVLYSPIVTGYADEHIGKLSPRAMITSKIQMEDVVAKGFKALVNERDKHVKILVEVQKPSNSK
ncbi:hypothetical protein CNMCM8980_003028 [Aspergillus fumigatiaffinis]|uniref:Probable D-xylulose reductase A n=1 Tax=Aspergillus fumigatiaffinis TaxID=340414 RepID=A0A8H4EG99_9EURO|nr:hypothetical protein CNMCM5878_003439 [Aspergillus fumigatiaffinis]KAF4222462.1 hypothetical protein CNMCM6457_001412 [Aspergillus fumigatiaffinis]KAF4230031.1 hypothetical protein CNMCM6805_000996 [Aspergillus fumigatiaffinis]KAF4236114.1 hypothetical protein CNMCM8980_003028 [Aspergillus fumigatiaffinis]